MDKAIKYNHLQSNHKEEKMKKLMLALTIAAMGMFYSAPAEAFTQTTTGIMNIAARVLASCTVTTAPLDFGNLSATSPTNVNSTITVNCSSGAPYQIDIDGGLNHWVAGTSRYLKTGTAPADATNTVGYSLYQDVAMTTVWGDGVTILPSGKTGTGTGINETHMVYGSAAAFSTGIGAYSDTVTVTVNY